jgi:predicted metal-binding protein
MAKRQIARLRKLPARQIIQAAMKQGAIGAKIVPTSSIETAPWVRWKCQFGCGGFGSSLVCPPHSPTPRQTRSMLDAYKRAVLFESPPGRAKRIAVALERHLFLAGFYKAFGLGAGPCSLCGTCALERGCRHPHQARPAMEACGIDVFASARKHGFTINVVRSRQDPQHYFGLVLVE